MIIVAKIIKAPSLCCSRSQANIGGALLRPLLQQQHLAHFSSLSEYYWLFCYAEGARKTHKDTDNFRDGRRHR
jgi:hypothetical protein